MTRLHKVKCDRCGEVEDLVYFNGHYFLSMSWEMPKGWSNQKDRDLCRDCTSEYLKYLKGFK